MHENAGMADAMRAAGAMDYLSKSGAPELIISAIRACAASGRPPAFGEAHGRADARGAHGRAGAKPSPRANARPAKASVRTRRVRRGKKPQKRS
jgi:DNA-binding NarL/FixJ family response regulator